MKSASRQRDRADLLLSLLPVLEEFGVSLYLSGHDHCYQRFGPSDAIPVPLVVSGGGGKRLYDVRPDPRAAALSRVHHWCEVEIEGEVFRVRAVGIDGAVADEFRLELPAGERLERIRVRAPRRAARIDRLR